MFQLAFAHAASRRLGTSFTIEGAPQALLVESFEPGELWPPWARGGRLAFAARHPRRELVSFDNHRDDPVSVLARLRDGVRYSGFFQSARYFAGYEDEIRSIFTFSDSLRAEFDRRFEGLGFYVAVHVRRRDYLETPWALPASFYRRALEAAGDISGLPVIVVSDDPASARREFRDLPGVRVESNEAIVDLQLLANAEVVVLSASSFSWWGAWLNQRPSARVVAPLHWLGFASGVEEPRGSLQPDWIPLAVERDLGTQLASRA